MRGALFALAGHGRAARAGCKASAGCNIFATYPLPACAVTCRRFRGLLECAERPRKGWMNNHE
jgi:hypothetical protein